MNFLDFFRPKQKPAQFPGLLEDNRTSSQKARDFTHEELFTAAAPVEWKRGTLEDVPQYPIKDQDGSSSCVANATAKLLGIENQKEEGWYVDLSARDIYARRANLPGEGMFFYDALDIAKKLGATLEELVPSNGKNEEAMNSLPDYKGSYGQIARVFKSGGYVEITNRTIDNVAAILAQGKPVLLGFTFTYAEWQARPAIGLYPPNLRHAVVATPYGFFLDTDGKKCIVIEDSWGLDRTTIGGRRVIDEMFFTRRSIFAGYVADLDNNWRDKAPEKPKVRLTIPLHRNETSDAIVGLQNILKYEQLFPQATQSTGFYGAVTSRGVAAYKALHGLAGNGDTVDAAMIDTINATYGI